MTGLQPLPGDAILLHLGFHKTGTTALQSAFAASRPALLEHGVLYPGRRRSHHPAAMAMTQRTWGVGREGGWDPDPRDWERLARAATRHPGRVLISSESFALTPDDAAARMVADLGPDRVHVVFTMRPMAALLSSSWQQYLKSGWTTTYEQWLDQVVAELEPGARRSGFWLRNDYPAIVGRWAGLVGAHRVHLVCLDGADRGFLLRTFRGLLDLPEGVPDEQAADSNRSMTAAEAELLRSLNEVSSDWDWPTYQRTIRTGAAAGMVESRRPDPGEAAIGTPPRSCGGSPRTVARWPLPLPRSGWSSTGTSPSSARRSAAVDPARMAPTGWTGSRQRRPTCRSARRWPPCSGPSGAPSDRRRRQPRRLLLRGRRQARRRLRRRRRPASSPLSCRCGSGAGRAGA